MSTGAAKASFALITMLLLAATAYGQQTPAPVPPQIAAAKRVFISNNGSDAFTKDWFGRDRDYFYNEFYGAMKKLARFEVVTAPQDADLILEVEFDVEPASAHVLQGDTIGPMYDPQLRLVFLDPKTQIVLWALMEHVQPALLKGNRTKNLDAAIAKIIEDAKSVLAPGSAAPSN